MSPEAETPSQETVHLPGVSTVWGCCAGYQGSQRPWSCRPWSGHISVAGETRMKGHR